MIDVLAQTSQPASAWRTWGVVEWGIIIPLVAAAVVSIINSIKAKAQSKEAKSDAADAKTDAAKAKTAAFANTEHIAAVSRKVDNTAGKAIEVLGSIAATPNAPGTPSVESIDKALTESEKPPSC